MRKEVKMTDEKVVKLGQKRTKKPSETQHKNHEETLNNELVYCSFVDVQTQKY